MLKKVILLLFFIFSTVFLVEKWISLQTNTLASRLSWYYPNYRSATYFLGLIGTEEFLFQRQSLAQEKLNLGSWFGYQQVTYKESLQNIKQVKINFNLEERLSYLWIYLDCNDEACWAFRASSDALYPTGLYLIKNSGEFAQKQVVNLILPTGAHQLQMNFTDDSVDILVDSEKIQNHHLAYPQRPLRFLNGYKAVSLKDIELQNLNGESQILDFKAPFSLKRYILLSFILILSSMGLFLLNRKNWNTPILVNFVILILSLLLYIFDYSYWSSKYLIGHVVPNREELPDFISSLEKKRMNLFFNEREHQKQIEFIASNPWQNFYELNVNKSHRADIFDLQILQPNGSVHFVKNDHQFEPSSTPRLAFLGGSQTWGAGASEGSETFASLTTVALKMEGANYAACGDTLDKFFKKVGFINKYHPQILVLNIGFNDSQITPNEVFKKRLIQLLKDLSASNSKIILSIEPTSFEESSEPLEKASAIKQVAQENNIPLLDLNAALKSTELRDTGLLWQDQVHLSDYGHQVTSRLLVQFIQQQKWPPEH